MTEASIPVDLFNPGQVFACLGFLEAADVLLGDAQGGFDWSNEADARFVVRAAGEENPFAVVLEFLAHAKVYPYAPIGYADPPLKGKVSAVGGDGEASKESQNLSLSETFPARKGDRMQLPVRLQSTDWPSVELSHWADGSSRDAFKLYAGNRAAAGIACDMLRGKRKPSITNGVEALWQSKDGNGKSATLVADPFRVTPMGGSFNFDARGAWTALDAGYSPNDQGHAVAASPVVEILAAWGLQHARPDRVDKRHFRYGAWSVVVPPILARPALAGLSVAVPARRFLFELALSGKNKVVTFAKEEISA